jgi:RNA recognition motif-containing protein
MNIYVGNLAYAMQEEDLQDLFAGYGPVASVNIIKDRDTGNSKGFGFVEMENEADGEKAIQDLDGSAVKGRNIKVNQARPRTERPKTRNRNW